MKKYFNYLLLSLFALIVFSSCEKDEPELYPSALVKGAYIINYGSYDKGGSSISRYDYEKGELTNFFDQQQNKGTEFASNIQFAYKTGDHIFLTGNSPDQLISLDPLMVQAKNGVSNQIVKPRSCVADGKYLYVSCWGGDIWTDESLSYIAKFNIETSTVEKKIALAGGPEGLEISNGKLYAALNYKKAVAVIDLSTEAISYIETPAVCSYFLKDDSGNLYVSLISSYSVVATKTGLGYINTSTNALTVYELDNVSTEYASIMAFSKDKSKIYVAAAAYDANWVMVGGVQVFDVATKTFADSSLVSGISGLKGLSVNPVDGNIYVFVAPSTTTNGVMKIYSEAGQAIAEKAVGASPTMAIFLN
jgi:DNA-binding beta-propeller fold protein YncE